MLFKKMLRDIKENKMQFIAIFLMSFITLLAFAGIGSEVQDLQDNLNDYYNETNMADAYALGINFNDSVIKDFKNMDSTTGIESQFVVKSIAYLKDEPTVTLHFLEKNNISKYYPVKGGNINFSDENGIWLDARFAEEKNLDIGDNISLNFNGVTINKTIRGLAYSPDYVYEEPENGLISDFKYQGFGYLSDKAYPSPDMPHNKLLMTSNVNNQEYYNQTHKRSIIGKSNKGDVDGDRNSTMWTYGVSGSSLAASSLSSPSDVGSSASDPNAYEIDEVESVVKSTNSWNSYIIVVIFMLLLIIGYKYRKEDEET